MRVEGAQSSSQPTLSFPLFKNTGTQPVVRDKKKEDPNIQILGQPSAKRTPGPERSTLSAFFGGDSKAEKRDEEEEIQDTKPPERSTLSMFFGGNEKAGKEQQELAVLSKWKQNADGSITGLVKNKKGFNDGTIITTSPVKKGAKSGTAVRTAGGSLYQLR
jgi:hypothetical protein